MEYLSKRRHVAFLHLVGRPRCLPGTEDIEPVHVVKPMMLRGITRFHHVGAVVPEDISDVGGNVVAVRHQFHRTVPVSSPEASVPNQSHAFGYRDADAPFASDYAGKNERVYIRK